MSSLPKLPKRASSGYVFYLKEIRKGSAFSEKAVPDNWCNMTEAERAKYNRMAEQDKIRYQREMEAFLEENPTAVFRKRFDHVWKKALRSNGNLKSNRASNCDVKQPRSALNYFISEKYSVGMSSKSIKEARRAWEELEDKKKYIEMARRDNLRYAREMRDLRKRKEGDLLKSEKRSKIAVNNDVLCDCFGCPGE